MAITLGTDTYVTVADADTYHTNRGNTGWTGATTEAKEIALRKATDYLDRQFTFRGYKQTQTQLLDWPRYEAYTDDGWLVGDQLSNLPKQLTDACCIVAEIYRSGSANLDRIVVAGTQYTKKTKVDVIEIEYELGPTVSESDVPTHVYKLLRPILVGGAGGSLQRA